MKISVNFNNICGKIKPMHAVGQPPFKGGFAKIDFSPIGDLRDAHIPYSRLHDVGGPFGGNRYVDIPNIFRDFNADVDNPDSYDFAFTDELIKGLMEYGVQPYFRLGVTIENQSFIKAYRIHPPADYDKWAKICEHIIRHYNEGWADGFHFGIQYWEIWNEADNRPDPKQNQMWTGTPEEFYRLYDVTAKHLKKCFGDSIKVGGYASCGFYGIFADPAKYGLHVARREEKRFYTEKEQYRLAFFFGFMEYIKEHNSPIDFFSWHTYEKVDVACVEAEFVDKVLTEYGYGHIETHMNEWNLSHDRLINKATSFASANDMAMMIGMHRTKTDMLMYYDARHAAVSAYAGFYDVVTFELTCVYYAFKAFGELYALGNEVECSSSQDNVFALAAKDGDKKAIILTNIGSDVNVELNLDDAFEAYIIDKDHLMTKTESNPKDFVLKENTILFLKNY